MLARLSVLIVVTACDVVFPIAERTPASDAAAVDATVDASPRAMLQDDFDDGLDPRWVRAIENGDRCEVTTEHKVSGTSSLRCQTDNTSGSKASLVLGFDPTATLRVQMKVRFASLPFSFMTFLQTAHTNEMQNQRLTVSDLYADSQVDVWNDRTMTFDFAPSTISLNTWHQIDWQARMSSTTGRVELVLDNIGRAALENVDTTDLPITQLQIGIVLLTRPIEQMTIYIDDVVISEQ